MKLSSPYKPKQLNRETKTRIQGEQAIQHDFHPVCKEDIQSETSPYEHKEFGEKLNKMPATRPKLVKQKHHNNQSIEKKNRI